MKNILLFCVVILTTNLASAQVTLQNYYNNGRYVFDDENKVLVEELFTTYKTQLGLGNDDEMELIMSGSVIVDSTDTMDVNNVVERYHQKYQGYPVENKSISVFSKCGVALMVTGSVLSGLDIVEPELITEEDALDIALGEIESEFGYLWDNDSAEYDIKEETGDSTATNYPKGELVVSKKYGDQYGDSLHNYSLCWKFYLSYYDTVTADSVLIEDSTVVASHTDTVLKHRLAYIDAQSGAVVSFYDHGESSSHTGDQWTWYYGYKNDEIVTRKRCPGCNYLLADDAFRIYGKWAANSDTYVKDNNNNWVEADTKTAAQGHWALTKGFQYFTYRHGVNPYPSDKFLKVLYGDYTLNFTGISAKTAEGPSGPIIIVRTDEIHNGYPSSGSALDIMNHELTHAFINNSSRVGAKQETGEPAALKEGFCDIFGMLVEGWTTGGNDWEFGEDMAKEIRYFSNPNDDTYTPGSGYKGDAFWQLGNGDRYVWSGVLRKWFYRLAYGDASWGPSLSGIGVNKAADLAFILMTWWLWEGSDYQHAREQSLLVAEKHFGGACGPVWSAVEHAWSDVGVGGISFCNTKYFRWYGKTVVKMDEVGSNIIIGIAPPIPPHTSGVDHEVIDYDWIMPAHWNVTYTINGDGFAIDDVNGNLSSQMVTVVVNYTKTGLPGVFHDTLTFPIHFSDMCGASKSGRHLLGANLHESKKLTEVKVYPNPTATKLYLEGIARGSDIQLFNMLGQSVYLGLSSDIIEVVDIERLPQGIYMLYISDNKGNKDVRRIIKE